MAKRTTSITSINIAGVPGGPSMALSQASSGVAAGLSKIGNVLSLGMKLHYPACHRCGAKWCGGNQLFDTSGELMNTEPAGILQSPFFDLASDPAVNFGGIGVVAAHELTHGFDDLGSKFDDKGNVREWQTPDDRKNFAERTSCEIAEYSQLGAMPDPEDLPTIKVNGKLTQAENTADNGGLRIAFLALTQALAAQGKTAEYKIDGFTEAQRFFLSFAQVWCQNQNFRSARQAAAADPHSPGRWRVNGAVENFDEFGKTFQCTKGARMYPVYKELIAVPDQA